MVDVDKFNLLLNVVEPIVKEKIHSFEDSFRNRNEETSESTVSVDYFEIQIKSIAISTKSKSADD